MDITGARWSVRRRSGAEAPGMTGERRLEKQYWRLHLGRGTQEGPRISIPRGRHASSGVTSLSGEPHPKALEAPRRRQRAGIKAAVLPGDRLKLHIRGRDSAHPSGSLEQIEEAHRPDRREDACSLRQHHRVRVLGPDEGGPIEDGQGEREPAVERPPCGYTRCGTARRRRAGRRRARSGPAETVSRVRQRRNRPAEALQSLERRAGARPHVGLPEGPHGRRWPGIGGVDAERVDRRPRFVRPTTPRGGLRRRAGRSPGAQDGSNACGRSRSDSVASAKESSKTRARSGFARPRHERWRRCTRTAIHAT